MNPALTFDENAQPFPQGILLALWYPYRHIIAHVFTDTSERLICHDTPISSLSDRRNCPAHLQTLPNILLCNFLMNCSLRIFVGFIFLSKPAPQLCCLVPTDLRNSPCIVIWVSSKPSRVKPSSKDQWV